MFIEIICNPIVTLAVIAGIVQLAAKIAAKK